MKKTIGVFLSDVHIPDQINLKPVFQYVKDLYARTRKDKNEFLLILGGDIIDAQGLHGVDSMPPSEASAKLWNSYYKRDCSLLETFLKELRTIVPEAKVVYLEGNHCERYQRIMRRYPETYKGKYDFNRDVVSQVFPKATWIAYGTYESYFRLGDCIFLHGTVYPTNHAKKYAEVYAPFKVVYGHLHHYQAFTIHNATPELPAHFAVTAGCLTKLSPDWKKGQPHMWQLGFCDFISDGKTTIPNAHVLDPQGRFMVAGKLYQ